MFRQSMFVIVALMAALMLGCEKKESTPTEGDAAAATETANEKAEEAVEAAEDAVEKAEDAAGDIKIPGQ